MRNGRPRRLEPVIVLACLAVVAASSAPTTMQLKQLKLKGTPGTEEILDWAPTSPKAGIAVLCSGDNTRECEPGVALLKTNGKSKPFKSFGHDDATAALAWPGGGLAARGAKPTGVAAVVVRQAVGQFDRHLILHTGRVLANGRVKGSLSEEAVIEEDVATGALFAPRALAAWSGDRVGVVVAYRQSGSFEEFVYFLVLSSKGALIGKPIALTFSGPARAITITPNDLIGTDGGWIILATQRPDSANALSEGPSRLIAWEVPVDARGGKIAATTVEDVGVPANARATTVRGTFVRDAAAPTVFVEQKVLWTTEEARKRRVGVTETTHYLMPLGLARAAQTPVAVEAWDRIDQIWNHSASAVAYVWDSTSRIVQVDGQHLFALARTSGRAAPMQSPVDYQQEFSLYAVDPDTGVTELLSRSVQKDDTEGEIDPVLLRGFGKTAFMLFNFDLTFAHLDQPLLASY